MNDDFDAGGELTPRRRGGGASVFVLLGIEDEPQGMRTTGAIDEGANTVTVERVTNTVFGVRRRKFCTD